MIYSHLKERLGNVMFEVAAGASLAKKMDVPYRAHNPLSSARKREGDEDQFRKSILRKIDFQDNYPEDVEIYNEPDFSYVPLPLKDNLCLAGFFQSEKYFDKELVRSLFEIDRDTAFLIQKKYGRILAEKPVCINVRRGDYLLYEFKHPVCRMAFFNRAISLFPPDTLFLVISDGIEWCKAHFKGKQFYFIDNEPPLIDLYLQTMCSHNIISNSTFSWWGAWLNPNPDKKVIYPSPWFGPRYKKELNTNDLCPDDWIAVPISGKFALYCRTEYSYKKDKVKTLIYRICHRCRKIINRELLR